MSMPYSRQSVHARELGADPLCRDVGREVQVHVRHARAQHLGVDAARDHVARGEVLPLGVVTIHERPASLVDEPRAGAAHRLGDQETRRVAVVERRRVELHVLGVDHARAGAVSHRDTVAAGARRVGRAQEDLPQAAGGEDRGRARSTLRSRHSTGRAHRRRRRTRGRTRRAGRARGAPVSAGRPPYGLPGISLAGGVAARRSMHSRSSGRSNRPSARCAASSVRPRAPATGCRPGGGRREP